MLLLLLLQAAAPAPAPAPAAPASAAPAPAAWEVRDKTNPNGTMSVSTSVIARDGSSRLTVKCDKGAEAVVSVQFVSRQQLQEPAADGAYAPKSVGLRFDNGPAIAYDWQFQGRVAYNADAPAVTALTMFLSKAKAVQVETTTASNFAFMATFDAPKTDAPIRQVLSACGYTLGQVPPPVAAAKK
ncbi:hypothetical protein H5J25_13195 [Sphingomonas aliaeris]|uniref:Invasion associated locus B family protein n=1 Tax=Sphingomonas aliaeris TaxID=2759526 RepID=A0A974S3H0_9SPHN|nr:hypothetical protein [Sphingomonas aliaeris]QQV76419.1 hypothetical protein H5J25_13195 [Sphingomonas aliaeris]